MGRNRGGGARRWAQRAIAWALFVCSAAVIVTGWVVTESREARAQDAGPSVALEAEPGAAPKIAPSAAETGGEPAALERRAPEAIAEGDAEGTRRVSFEVRPGHDALTIDGPTPGGVTGDETPRLGGRAAPGQELEVVVDGAIAGRAKADGDGTWSLALAAPLGAGPHTAEVREAPPAPRLRVYGQADGSSFAQKAISFFGIFVLLGVAFLMSNARRKIDWRLVGVGVALQLVFALFIFYVPFGKTLFSGATEIVKRLLGFTDAGSMFLFESFVSGSWDPALINFAFAVLPTIIFFSSLMTVLYHLGVMQRVVWAVAWVMQRAMGISGAESLSAAANIFVGQTEAPLVIKPYVESMTRSELMTVMTGGFATVAGGVLAVYVKMLGESFPDIAGHLLAASVMSAPAALVVGKIIVPEVDVPETTGTLTLDAKSTDANVIDAATRGAGEGLALALNVAAMLLAFVAIVAMINYVIGLPSAWANGAAFSHVAAFYAENGIALPPGCTADLGAAELGACVETMNASILASGLAGAAEATASTWGVLTLESLFGWLFYPFAFVMGVPIEDCALIGRLLGEKMILTELIAYESLAEMLADPSVQLSDRSVIIATYALCGFANVGSIGIQLGGIGGIAPSRRGDLAKLAVRAMIAGTLAAFMTATIAGILV